MQITHAMNNYGVKVDVLDGYLNTLYTGREIDMVNAVNIETNRAIWLYRLIGKDELVGLQSAQLTSVAEEPSNDGDNDSFSDIVIWVNLSNFHRSNALMIDSERIDSKQRILDIQS